MTPAELKAFLEETDAYKVLGLDQNATKDEIRKAYWAISKRYHPDRILITRVSVEEATLVMAKINEAKEALDRGKPSLKMEEEDKDKPPQPYQKFQTFLYWVSRYGLDMKIAHICNTSGEDGSTRDSYERWKAMAGLNYLSLAANLSWLSARIEGRESEALAQYQTVLKSKPAYPQVLAYATYLSDFVKLDKLDDLINTRRLHQALNAKITDESKKQETLVNFCWAFDHNTLMSLLIEQMSLLPNTPFLIACKDENLDFYISIVFDGTQYKVFSPYEPRFVESKPELASMSEAQLRQSLLEHFYQRDRCELKVVAVSNYVSNSINLSDLGSNQPRVMTESNFKAQLLQDSSDDPDYLQMKVLNIIRNGKIKGLLNQYFQLIPEWVIEGYTEDAVKAQDWHMATEILVSAVDPQTRTKIMRLVLETFYTSAYENKHKVFYELRDVCIDAGLDFDAYITAEDKAQPHWLTPSLPALARELTLVEEILDSGFVFTAEQTAILADEFIANTRKLSVDRRATNHVKALISLLERMLNEGYRFIQKEGLPSDHYLHWMINGFWCLDARWSDEKEKNPERKALYKEQLELHEALVHVLKRGILAGAFNLNVKDDKGNTLLNESTAHQDWALVKFLYDLGAEYATGDHIDSYHIPPLRARINEVESMKFSYESLTVSDWLAIKTSHHDILCACLVYENCSSTFLNQWLDYFENKLRDNILPYLLSSSHNPEKMNRVLEKSGLRKGSDRFAFFNQSKISTAKPKPLSLDRLYDKYVQVMTLDPLNLKSDHELPNELIGLPLMATAQELSNKNRLSVKIFTADNRKFYLSWHPAIEEAMIFLMLPYLDEKLYKELNDFDENTPRVVDLPLVFDQLSVIREKYIEGYNKWCPTIKYVNELEDLIFALKCNALPPSITVFGMIISCDDKGVIEQVTPLKGPADLYHYNSYKSHDLVTPMSHLNKDRVSFWSGIYVQSRYPLYELLATKTPLVFSKMAKPLPISESEKKFIDKRMEQYKNVM